MAKFDDIKVKVHAEVCEKSCLCTNGILRANTDNIVTQRIARTTTVYVNGISQEMVFAVNFLHCYIDVLAVDEDGHTFNHRFLTAERLAFYLEDGCFIDADSNLLLRRISGPIRLEVHMTTQETQQ